MLEILSERLSAAIGRITRKGTLSQKDINDALREVRLALLEADVELGVVRSFIENVREKSSGQDVFSSLTPGQTILKIVHEELKEILGGAEAPIVPPDKPPVVIMLVGLQGSGKTATASKIARLLKQKGHKVMMAACDLQRPAAIQQLQQLGNSIDVHVYTESPAKSNPLKVATAAIQEATKRGATYLIVDTAGRQAASEDVMKELEKLHSRVKPVETLLVLDGMTGQSAILSGKAFHEKIKLTGLVLSKMDGDARGGALLSMRATMNVPVKLITTGERTDQLEEYHPSRLASRILGMGDIETLVEKARANIDTSETEKISKRISKGHFNMNDLLEQLRAAKSMGPLSEVMALIPGMNKSLLRSNQDGESEKRIKQAEAVILSMTPYERANPDIIKRSRRNRIAAGAGLTTTHVNRILQQRTEMRKVIKKMKGKGKGVNPSLNDLFRLR